jgi:hypothetical protein
MAHYSELLEDDDETPDVGSELAVLSWRAGYGAALLDTEQANSSDAWGDRILDAADQMRSRDLWGDDE